MILQSTISQSSSNELGDISTLINAVTPVIDVTSSTILWMTPYLSINFPEIDCDKKYFFLWSTDHDTGAGGIWWGKGNNLDLSDLEDLGLVIQEYQSETPFLYRFPDEQESIYLYYHSNALEPSNNGQETRLITCGGGLLHSTSWTDRGRPLGFETGQEHSGYLKFYNVNNTLIGTHYKKGSNASTGYIGEWQYSTMSEDGLTSVRGGVIDTTTYFDENRRMIPSYGVFFNRFGSWWWIGETETTIGFSLTSPTKGLGVFKCNDNLEITQKIKSLDNGNFKTSAWNAYIEDNTAHLYRSSVGSEPTQYSKLNLVPLSQL